MCVHERRDWIRVEPALVNYTIYAVPEGRRCLGSSHGPIVLLHARIFQSPAALSTERPIVHTRDSLEAVGKRGAGSRITVGQIIKAHK